MKSLHIYIIYSLKLLSSPGIALSKCRCWCPAAVCWIDTGPLGPWKVQQRAAMAAMAMACRIWPSTRWTWPCRKPWHIATSWCNEHGSFKRTFSKPKEVCLKSIAYVTRQIAPLFKVRPYWTALPTASMSWSRPWKDISKHWAQLQISPDDHAEDGKIWQPQSREMPRMTEKDVRSHSGTSAIVVLSVKKEHWGRTCWARTCWLRTVQVETL